MMGTLAFNELNGVNIMKGTRAVDLIKLLVDLIFNLINNKLILLISCYVKCTINPTRKSDNNHKMA